VRRVSLGLVAVLTGCTLAGEEKTIDERRADELVLQREDVDPGFRQTWIRNLGRGRTRSEVQYRRRPSPARRPLRITSAAEVLESGEAADAMLDAASEALRRKSAWQPIAEPGLGDESFAATVLQSGVRHYDVFWRAANVTASLSVTAAEDAVPLGDVLELARKQDERIDAAASQ
jgi:hypothetical protein